MPAPPTHGIRFGLVVACVLFPFITAAANGQGLGVVGNMVTLSDGSRVLQVQSAVRGGLADRVGMIAGDNIHGINGFPPSDAAGNERAIAAGRGLISIDLDRQGRRLTLGNGFPGSVGPTYPDEFADRPGQIPVGGSLTRPAAGPELQIDLEISSTLSGDRLRVSRVTPGGLGQKRGLRVGDVIDSINGIRVSSLELARRAYIYRNGRIVLRVIQQGLRREVVFLRKPNQLPGDLPNKKPVIDRPLGLKSFRNNTGLVVLGGTQDGLGRELGIAQRGTIIRSINGKATRVPADLMRIDEAIAAGSVSRLVIEVERAGGKRETVRYPR
jgi:S1-C subfamily serine protease